MDVLKWGMAFIGRHFLYIITVGTALVLVGMGNLKEAACLIIGAILGAADMTLNVLRILRKHLPK